MSVPFGEYVLGWGLLGAMLAACGVAASLMRRRVLGHLAGATAATAWGLLMTAAVLAVHVVPLALGVLSRVTVLLAAALLVAAATRLPRRLDGGARPVPERPSPPVGWAARVPWLLAAAAVAGLALYVVAFAKDRLATPITGVDALVFHLPQVGRWIETGSLWQIDNFTPGWAFGNYPNNGNIFQLAAILPWDNDALVRFVSYPFLLLAGLAVYAAARELDASRPTAVIAAALLLAMPQVMGIALDFGSTDTVMVAAFAGATLFGLRHWSTRARSDLVLAALGLGLALGTKWYGVSSAALVVIVWLVARLIARERPRAIAGDALIAAGVMAAAGGIWMVRNLILSANPVFPVKVGFGGLTIFDAPPDPIREASGFPLLHYATDWGVWREIILGQLYDSFGIAGGLMALAAVVAIVLAWRAGERRVVAAAVAALGLLLVYAATPYSGNGAEGNPILVFTAARYAIPAFVVAAPVAAWLMTRSGPRGEVVLQALGVILVAEAMLHYDDIGLAQDFDVLAPRTLAFGVLGVLALAAAGYAAWRRPWSAWEPTVRRAALGAVAAVLLIAAVAGGDRQQDRLNSRRYADMDAAYAWLQDNARDGRRIGITGLWPGTLTPPPWVAFGPRIGNRVEYLGPFVRERMERYEDGGAYRAALRRSRPDVVLVGNHADPGERIPELAWTRAAGYRQVLRSRLVTVFEKG